MTKQFIVYGRNNQATSLEFSELRQSWYKTIVAMWNNPNTQGQLNQYINLCMNGTHKPCIEADDMKEVIDTLTKIGLMNKKISKPGFFESIRTSLSQSKKYNYYKVTLEDPDFLRHCFFMNDNSSLIHLTDIHLVEDHPVKGKSDVSLKELYTPDAQPVVSIN